MIEPKPKPCKADGCTKTFTPMRTTAIACSWECAQSIAKGKLAKKQAKETSRMRREMNAKSRTYQLKKAQEAFNAFIRERDKGLPCISCGGTKGKMTAGHYKTAGASPELRFNEDNCHGQCWWNCNKNRSGNIAEYRPNLVKKIGVDRVEWLEGPHEPQNYTLDDIIEIKLKYRRKLKEMKQRGNDDG